MDNDLELLKNLPRDLLSIVAAYNPECLFAMDKQWILDYNWELQCKLSFGVDYGSLYAYYNLCQRDRPQIGFFHNGEFIINNGELYKYSIIMGSRRIFTKIKNVPKNIVQIACSDVSNNILTSDGHLYTEQDGSNFETVKDLDIVQIASGICHDVILRRNGMLMCSENCAKFEEIKDAPNDVVKIACGEDYTIIMRADGTLMGMGMNSHGELGLGDKVSRKQFVEIDLPKDVVQIACGRLHTVVLRANGVLMSCGSNDWGQLGLGHYCETCRFEKVEVPKDIVHIGCGAYCTFLMRANGSVLCCGDNYNGELGLDANSVVKFEEIPNIPKDIRHITSQYDKTFLTTSDSLIFFGRSR